MNEIFLAILIYMEQYHRLAVTNKGLCYHLSVGIIFCIIGAVIKVQIDKDIIIIIIITIISITRHTLVAHPHP